MIGNELPKGWILADFLDAVEIFDNLRKPINSKERQRRIAGKDTKNLFPYYGATGQVGYIDDFLSDGEYVLLGEDGAPFLDTTANKAYLISGKAWVNNHAHVLRSKTSNKFLCYYLNQFNYKDYVSGTTRYKLTQEKMKRIPVLLPPLAEQHRIVAKIEELFAELDRGIAGLEKAKAQLKTYRQAVLKGAFQNGLNSINIVLHDDILGNHLTEIKAGKSYTCVEKPPKDNEIGLLNISSVTWGTFNEAESKTCPTNKCLNEDYLVRKGDFLFSRANTLELVGSCVIVDKITKTLMLSDKILRFSFDELTNKKYVLYYLRSPYGRQEIEKYASGNQLSMRNIGQKKIEKIMIPFCSPIEQTQIVSAIESRLSFSDSLEKSIDSSLKNADLLRMSILKKAFAGELVGQDPADAPSLILSKENT